MIYSPNCIITLPKFWTPRFLDSTLFRLDFTFWLESTVKLYYAAPSLRLRHCKQGDISVARIGVTPLPYTCISRGTHNKQIIINKFVNASSNRSSGTTETKPRDY